MPPLARLRRLLRPPWLIRPDPHADARLIEAALKTRLPAHLLARPPAEVEDSGGASGGAADFLSSLLQQSYRVEPPGSGDMRHGTEGWKCLETSFRVRT